MDETLRTLYEKTLIDARKMQSDSGFILQNEKIVLYDNFLFALLLFRSKTSENVLEGKKLLDHLLYFQQNFDHLPSKGNFPLLLSDYPFCQDHLQALKILTPLTYITREFSHILGSELKARLDKCMQDINSYLEKVEIKLPVWAKALMGKGLEEDFRYWADPYYLAEMIIAYQLNPSDDYKPFWSYLSKVWHAPSHKYVGPAYNLGLQHPNLLTAMALFSKRLDILDSYPLYGTLLTTQNALEAVSYPSLLEGKSDRFSWSVKQLETFSYSTLIGKPRSEEISGFFPYYLVAGEHSLAMHAPYGYSTEELVFEICPEVFQLEKEKAKALVISFNDHKDNKVLVEGEKATCFTFADSLDITLGTRSFIMSFERLSGDGEFVGHILRGTRSGQPHDRFSAHDVQILIRALRGTLPTAINVKLCI